MNTISFLLCKIYIFLTLLCILPYRLHIQFVYVQSIDTYKFPRENEWNIIHIWNGAVSIISATAPAMIHVTRPIPEKLLNAVAVEHWNKTYYFHFNFKVNYINHLRRYWQGDIRLLLKSYIHVITIRAFANYTIAQKN